MLNTMKLLLAFYHLSQQIGLKYHSYQQTVKRFSYSVIQSTLKVQPTKKEYLLQKLLHLQDSHRTCVHLQQQPQKKLLKNQLTKQQPMLKWTKQQQNLQLFQNLSQTQTNSLQNSQASSTQKPSTTNSSKPPRKKRYTTGNSNLNHHKMPTMTHTLERRLHRRSLDNHLDEAFNERRNRSRHSLTGNHNKENFGVHFMRNSFGNTSLTALHDLSNGKSPRRSTEHTPPPLTLNIKRLNTATVTTMEMIPQQNGEVRPRFSDDFAEEDDITPLSRLKFRNKLKEDSLSSSRMGDVTLDRMLDAIIESARKDVKPKCKHVQMEEEKNLENVANEDSIHEMEVRTPQHLKRQRVVRRKNPKNTEKKNKKEKPQESENLLDKSFQERQRVERREKEMIGLTLPNGIPSPETPLFKNSQTQKALLSMETPPQHLTFEVENDLQSCSTPTLMEVPSIKRCLSFSSNSEEEEDYHHIHKRSSVASSIASSTHEQLSGSSTNLTTSSVRGSLDVAIYRENESLNVHVIRCRDLQRSNGSTNLNAYVKVALNRKSQAEHQGFKRTAVHRHSSRPYFDHCFKFDLSDLSQALNELDEDDRLQMAVWHRDRQLKRSEFLGCISFPLSTLLQQQEINGSFKLQTQQCLNKPQPNVTVQQLQEQQQQQQQTLTTTPSLQAAAASNHFCPYQAATNHLPETNSPPLTPQLQTKMATTMTQMRNADDAVSIDSMATGQLGSEQQPMILSKKALHQRDADENLFLRFLELDPPSTEPAPSQGTPVAGRRLSITKPAGRTPFTMTKKLTRTAERGFGFSIVWTHPPRVEKVEPGLSADRCGIYPGDYVIFVDKHNVVTMPEADVLNLIRSQGATLTLEIFRRSGSGTNAGAAGSSVNTNTTATHRSLATTLPMNGKTSRMAASGTSINNPVDEIMTVTVAGVGKQQMLTTQNRPSTACSVNTNSTLEAAKRRLNLPQVTFSKESIVPINDNRRRFLLQLISREQNFMSALHFAMQRFVQPLQDRKDLITPNDHRTLFQNIDELLRLSEDILEQLCHDDQEPQMNFASRVYLSKTTAICAAYKKYCNGIKRADCVLVNKSRQTGSEFVNFITEPPVPRKRPDLTMFIHRPLQHFREILKLMQLLASNCPVESEEHKNFTSVINELQAAYREITVTSGLMEPLGEGRPLLTLQDLESRMVFTKCKPFTLAVQGRQWIFGGDLSRVEGRSVKPYWTLLFSDIIVFAKVSRDRVLFITEEPIPIANIVDSCFHMRKKTTEFRLTVDPNGRLAESPTGYCAPDLTKTPKKGARRKSLVLRAPSLELKAVWQNLLQRQIFLVNAALGSTPLSSPLDSPDVLNTLVPLSDIGIASASIGSIKLSSMDSINMKNQQHHHQQQNNRLSSNVSEQIEKLIDEKCRILNKTGTPKSSALHLANWMKGQLDKQQEQARLAVAQSLTGQPFSIPGQADTDDALPYQENDHDERITYWTRQQLEKRTQELNIAKDNGHFSVKPNFMGKRLSGVDELSMSDVSFSEGVSQISQSHSTTSDSQITVRSSPIVLDKLAVCRHCHKNCQQTQPNASPTSPHQSKTHPTNTEDKTTKCPLSPSSQMRSDSGLICHSLKVQHSQSSPQRCCNVNGGAGGSSNSRASSVTSISSGTVTGEKPSDNLVASSSKCEVGDTESDVAQLISDDVYQSEATDDGNTGGNTSSSISSSGVEEARRRITDSIHKLRILDEHNEAKTLVNGYCSQGTTTILTTTTSTPNTTATSTATSSGAESEEREIFKPEPPPRKFANIQPQKAKEIEEEEKAKEIVKMSVTVTETAKIVIVEDTKVTITPTKSPRSPKSPKSPKTPLTPKSGRSVSSSTKSNQFVACTCKCLPEDFANTTLSPEEVELQTCKMLESPKQSPKLPRSQNEAEDPHKYCKCTCDKTLQENLNTKQDKEDDDLSLMLIGLAQLTPAAKLLNMKTPTAPLPTPTQNFSYYSENGFVPTIAIMPATPDSVLTKTSTNVWDNTTHVTTSTATTNLLISQGPRQAIIENIPEDSCDESPLDEEPPYRPMSSTLRRFGTMSSLEILPSDDRLDDNLEEYDDDDEEDDDEDVDDEDEELMDKARADNIELDNEIRVVTKAIYENSDQAGSSNNLNGNAWTSRASTFVSGKMSFFEESRAFIDKYLGRWNQDQGNVGNNGITSDPEEQMDECTSGATSGEEVWGTPTSGGDNDDLHLANSENTQSSPTKSSNSLNDDDDTELMMDELLMAPPMSASTIRGLLPRRRLEPLFEEETESDEEKTQQESEELKKGETTTNGHYLEDSEAGGSSEEGEEEEEDQVNTADYDEEDEDLTSTEERLQPNLQTSSLGPRPLSQPILPPAVLKASSCEYLLDQLVIPSTANSTIPTVNSLATTIPVTGASLHTSSKTVVVISASTTLMMTAAAITTTTMTTNQTTICSPMVSTPQQTIPSPDPSLASTTTSKESVTIKKDKDVCSSSNREEEKKTAKTLIRPAKFIPPPPPPRRLLLTQTNLKTSGPTQTPLKMPPLQQKSGVFADDGFSVGAKDEGDKATHTANTGLPQCTATTKKTMTTTTTIAMSTIKPTKIPQPIEDVYNIKRYSAVKDCKVETVLPSTKPRPSSTIIETSLLGSGAADSSQKRPYNLSTTALMMKQKPTTTTRAKDQQQSQQQEKNDQGKVTKGKRAEQKEDAIDKDSKSACAQPGGVGSGLSPRLEMRLALNHDILGDEDLISYDPGPDLTTILGHDLSTFQRRTGRDLLNRSATNRVQPKEAVISFSQQRNSKMDTPTVNRRPRPQLNSALMDNNYNTSSSPASSMPFVGSARVGGVPQHLQPNRNTWSSSVSVDQNRDESASVVSSNKNINYNREDSKLSDLEILARREKIYCMSQLRSGSQVRMGTKMMMTTTTATTTMMKSNNFYHNNSPLTRTTSTTSMGVATEEITVTPQMTQRQRKIGRDETALMEMGKANKLISFIKRRNSENPLTANNSQTSLNDSNASSTPQHKPIPMSPRKDNDKPSLNRRLWKQITKRRRSNSVSELVAS